MWNSIISEKKKLGLNKYLEFFIFFILMIPKFSEFIFSLIDCDIV